MTLLDWGIVGLLAAPLAITVLLLLGLGLRDVLETARPARPGYWQARVAGISGLLALVLLTLANVR